MSEGATQCVSARYSAKQLEYINNANKRWNFKGGATRSGKTYLDLAYVIPKRLRATAGLDGLQVILGNTKGTLQRNIIEPLQKIWGQYLVSDIRSDNTATMFGCKVHCLGADKVNAVDRIRGSSFSYVYGDEVVTWHPDVFEMIKSRMDKSYSKMDATFNPANPNHWLKRFLDGQADIYHQHYTLRDNPFLDTRVADNIELEYSGTVFYDRYVLGLWKRAEGLCYPAYANAPQNYSIAKDEIPQGGACIDVGVDFGKSTSAHSYTATMVYADCVYVLKSSRVPSKDDTFADVKRKFQTFMDELRNQYPNHDIEFTFCDSAEPTYINTLAAAYPNYGIRRSLKREVLERVRATNVLMSAGRFFVVEELCLDLKEALQDAVWDTEEVLEDVRLDDGSTDIDSLDSFEYSFEYYIPQLVRL